MTQIQNIILSASHGRLVLTQDIYGSAKFVAAVFGAVIAVNVNANFSDIPIIVTLWFTYFLLASRLRYVIKIRMHYDC